MHLDASLLYHGSCIIVLPNSQNLHQNASAHQHHPIGNSHNLAYHGVRCIFSTGNSLMDEQQKFNDAADFDPLLSPHAYPDGIDSGAISNVNQKRWNQPAAFWIWKLGIVGGDSW